MGDYVDFKKAAIKLQNAYKSEDIDLIERAKVDCLFEAANYFELAINYVALENYGVHFDFGSAVIPKGTVLYRIRKFDDGVDYSNPDQWTPPPSRPENRANRQGQEALYLSISEETCLLETHTKEGDKYALGVYECIEDITVGGFFSTGKDNRMLYAGIALNALLIAPSRSDNNAELFELLDNHFGKILPDDIQFADVSTRSELILPFKFAVMNQRDRYYHITNQLCDIIRKKYPMGIRYSSCYIPIEMPYISSNAYNLVLYSEGASKVKFLRHCIKTNENKNFTSTAIAQILLNVEKKVNDQT